MQLRRRFLHLPRCGSLRIPATFSCDGLFLRGRWAVKGITRRGDWGHWGFGRDGTSSCVEGWPGGEGGPRGPRGTAAETAALLSSYRTGFNFGSGSPYSLAFAEVEARTFRPAK